MPDELGGFRTLFNAFHHFPPERARAILEDAVHKGQGIGVFEFTRPDENACEVHERRRDDRLGGPAMLLG